MPVAADEKQPEIPPGLRILVLEDDPMVSLLLEDMLGALGCSVLGPCAGTAAALAMIAQQTPQIALLDVHLGAGEDGYAVATALAERRVPFAFVTGDGGARLPAAFTNSLVLQKPFHLATMVRLIAELAKLSSGK